MAEWLSDEWLEAAAGLASSLPTIGDLSGTIDLAIATAPKREFHLHWSYADGVPEVGSPGPAPKAGLALSATAQDMALMVAGTIEPSVAYMRGRLKASGDSKLLLAFLRSTTVDGYEAWRCGVEALGLPEMAE